MFARMGVHWPRPCEERSACWHMQCRHSKLQYGQVASIPSYGERQQCLYGIDTTIALYLFLHGFHIHPCYDAGNAEGGPTRVLHLGSLLTLSGSDKEVLSLHLDEGKYLHLLQVQDGVDKSLSPIPMPTAKSVVRRWRNSSHVAVNCRACCERFRVAFPALQTTRTY